MVTVLNFKDIIDLPKWRPLSDDNATTVTFTTNNRFISDLRNNDDRDPHIFRFTNSTTITKYNTKSDEWLALPTSPIDPQAGFFMSAQGSRGVLAAGSTTTSVVISTALPATVGINQLANRGDGRGFKIRIIGNAGGSSGLTEERIIIGNTGETTTPTIQLDSPLSFTPIVGDAYEILSGRIFLGSVGQFFRYYDVATNSYSAALASAGSPTILGNSQWIGLDEQLVPYNRSPGEGFFGVLIATASGAASLTGQAVGGDAGVLLNEYRNFQIRIVQDIAIPTAVGQRRNITSHTAGPSPVYTVSAWAVTPSANAIYVIENNGDRILIWQSGNTNTFTYNIAANTWDTVTFGVRPTAQSSTQIAGHAFGITLDTNKNARHSFIFSMRGTNVIDLLDIAGAATGLWTGNITYGSSTTLQSFTNGHGEIDSVTLEGKYLYIFIDASTRFYRFDMKNRILETSTVLRFSTPVSTASLRLLATTHFQDGDTKLGFLIFGYPSSTTPNRVFGLPLIR